MLGDRAVAGRLDNELRLGRDQIIDAVHPLYDIDVRRRAARQGDDLDEGTIGAEYLGHLVADSADTDQSKTYGRCRRLYAGGAFS